MPVILTTSRAAPRAGAADFWCATDPAGHGLDGVPELAGIAALLERAYDAAAETWGRLAREMGRDPSAAYAHTPACAANVSDFGLMLAWCALVEEWAGGSERICVLCDDPWLYRQMAEIPGVAAPGRAPGLLAPHLRLGARGFLARSRAAFRLAKARRGLAGQRRTQSVGGAALLVYGHPASTADGSDAYFGPLMQEIPHLSRQLHVDCPQDRAAALSGPRTASLHAWGRWPSLLALPWTTWRPRREVLNGPYRWLLRRAARVEAGTGTAAMLRWQIDCQKNWLAAARPRVVAWPWENHSWERALVREARGRGVRTLGYVHVPVYWREWNFAPWSNTDGEAGLPDRIACCGPAAERSLRDLGVPADRLARGGGFRFSDARRLRHDPAGPVFVALPASAEIAAQMLDALRPLCEEGWKFLVKCHPLAPVPIREIAGIQRTAAGLDQQDGLRAVLYASTTVGLEALMGGLPTVRFLPRGIVGQGLPRGLADQPVDSDAAGLNAALSRAGAPAPIDRATVVAPPDPALWRGWLDASG